MRAIRFLLIIWAGQVLVGAAAAAARPEPQDLPIDPEKQFACKEGEIVTGRGTRTSRICPIYDRGKTRPGEYDVPLRITIAGEAVPKLLGVSLVEQLSAFDGQPDPITFRQIGMPATKSTSPTSIEYSYRMNISGQAKPRVHVVKLELGYPGEKLFVEQFFLRVRSEGGIKIEDAPKIIKGLTADTTPFQLKLSNDFDHYPVNLREIRVSSNHSNLVEDKVFLFPRHPGLKRLPVEPMPVDLSIKIAPMSIKQLFYGFDDDSKITLAIVYDDGDGELTDYKEIPLSVRPSVPVLLMAILFGVLAGCLIKLYMRSLPKPFLTRTEKLWFVFGTAAVGIVLSLVALFGEVQVVAFKLQGSYENPKLLFIVSLGVTIIGLPLVYTIFKLSKSGDQQEGQRAS